MITATSVDGVGDLVRSSLKETDSFGTVTGVRFGKLSIEFIANAFHTGRKGEGVIHFARPISTTSPSKGIIVHIWIGEIFAKTIC